MASIKCAHCKNTHTSVAEVRICAGQVIPATVRMSEAEYGEHQQALASAPRDPELRDSTRYQYGQTSQPAGNGLVERVKAAEAALPDLKNAHYAVEVAGILKFYQVDKPQQGRWKGYTFVKVQASDDLWPVKALASRVSVLEAIVAVGPEQAMQRYGSEIGQCGRCNRTLTDETSRQRGIGPDCWTMMGH